MNHVADVIYDAWLINDLIQVKNNFIQFQHQSDSVR